MLVDLESVMNRSMKTGAPPPLVLEIMQCYQSTIPRTVTERERELRVKGGSEEKLS